jgi:ribosomal protein S6--L-glutamate ligase
MLIYILSRGPNLYSTSRIYRAALNNKHNVRIIDHMHCDLLIEEGEFKVVYNNEILLKPDFVIPRIGSSATFYGTTVVRHFEQMGVPMLNSAMGIFNSRDKFRSIQLLAAQNIRIPSTYFSDDLHLAEKIIENKLGFPFILKVLEGTQGVGVYLVNDPIEATTLFNKFSRDQVKVLLQEFIAEFKGKDIRAFVVGNKVVAAMLRVASGDEFRSNLHRGGKGELVVLSEDEKELAIRAVRVLNLEVGGVDILRSQKGSMVIEVNSSPGLEGIEGVSQVKIAEEIISYIENKV